MSKIHSPITILLFKHIIIIQIVQYMQTCMYNNNVTHVPEHGTILEAKFKPCIPISFEIVYCVKHLYVYRSKLPDTDEGLHS